MGHLYLMSSYPIFSDNYSRVKVGSRCPTLGGGVITQEIALLLRTEERAGQSLHHGAPVQ
jgi:hypothetical protein